LIRNFFWGKLKTKLIASLIFAFLASLCLFLLLQVTGDDLLERYLDKTSFVEYQQNQALIDFENYIVENHIDINDQDKVTQWAQEAKYVNIYVYQNNKLLYATDGYNATSGDGMFLQSINLKKDPFHDIPFADTTAQIYLDCFFEFKYYYVVTFLGVFISFIFFILIMLFFINRKTSYISKLENEIKILEGGNLDYPITIKGNDELSSLAENINEMRKSFIERLENEDKAREANSELITAMSHDLRTPLTALIGYLDIIEYKKYKKDEDLNKYIYNSREKAYQIKHLSDKLFEYFTVFSIDDDNLELESFDGNQLVDQLIDEHLLILQSNDFQFQYYPCETPFQIEVHLVSIRRVFENIFANIIKYALPYHEIIIHCSVQDGLLWIQIQNHINPALNKMNSTGIGLKTCKKITEMHQGSLTISSTEELYCLLMMLPVHA